MQTNTGSGRTHVIRHFRATSTFDATFASCVAFLSLLIFNGIVSPILGPRLATLLGVEAYRIGWANDTPRSDEVVFPGDAITIRLQEQTLEGWYWIDNLTLSLNGSSIVPTEADSKKYGDKIEYHTEYPLLQHAGLFKFRIPNDDDLLGRELKGAYSLLFHYPQKLSDVHFSWASKPIRGSFLFKVGTASQRSSLHTAMVLVWVGALATGALCWFIAFAVVRRPLRRAPRAA